VFVFAAVTVSTGPVPPIFIFFDCFKEVLADNIRFLSFDILFLFVSDEGIELLFAQIREFSTELVHDKLGSLIDIKIDLLVTIKGEIMGVYTFFTTLTETLFEIRTDY
jgi:hypothetical protein